MSTDRDMILRSWFENEFKQALLDDERIKLTAAVMKVGVSKGHDPIEVIRRSIASFVGELIAPEIGRGESSDWLKRN